jgi:hypothetical protein
MKNMGLFVLLAFFASDSSFAAKCATKAPSHARWKECTNARPNAKVDQFLLTENGDLYAYLAKSDLLCSVTNNVTDMKVSRHPRDAAVLYFERQGNLYVAHNVRNNGFNCPEMSKKVLMNNVKKFNVVSNNNTTIVNTALSEQGEFLAWDNSRVVYSDRLVKDYLLNTNYGAEGKAFNRYVAFTIDYSGYVTKLEGRSEYNFIQSKDSNKRYSSLQSFKRDVGLND